MECILARVIDECIHCSRKAVPIIKIVLVLHVRVFQRSGGWRHCGSEKMKQYRTVRSPAAINHDGWNVAEVDDLARTVDFAAELGDRPGARVKRRFSLLRLSHALRVQLRHDAACVPLVVL